MNVNDNPLNNEQVVLGNMNTHKKRGQAVYNIVSKTRINIYELMIALFSLIDT